MKAEICPVCWGRGTYCNHDVKMPLHLHLACPTCHGCGGKGWVTVPEDDPYVTSTPINIPNTTYDPCWINISKCPACGQDKNEPPLTGCPKASHYGIY